VGWMHFRIGLHLVHAVIALLRVAVALLWDVLSTLLRLHIQGLAVTVEGLRSLLWRRCFVSRGMSVYRSGIGRVGAGASVSCRTSTK
jgi:hypothetical protein